MNKKVKEHYTAISIEDYLDPPPFVDVLKTSTILEEAAKITSTDRRETHGHPKENFQRIADLWSTILNIPVTTRQVGLMMIAVKLAREMHKPNRDNLVDIAGYARTIELLEETE